MVQIRENKQKHLIGHVVTMVLLCASLPTRATKTYGFDIVVAWTKEAAP
jgi:hypothetical protein